MPVVNIEYDGKKVKKHNIIRLSAAVHKIVSSLTKIEDVPVYANDSKVKVKVAPIEIFIRMSGHKIKNDDELIKEIKSQLSKWKKENKFRHPANLTLIPMKWKIEIGI